ncbi:alpha-amylase family glycosyl hydrolase [Microbulbifer yueqingensis]|uniref:Alpha-amylase n=1 Tax=Microbulbifer yueqingensis TaxID=658219 RepID=A0A1G8Y875_9GAMM|nr:alpha-amylase family glycosyl hydrolase [Microbulbifer yueqingensis]SDJ98988.1 alpha-amylase [Microbulbifer yueqingensis]
MIKKKLACVLAGVALLAGCGPETEQVEEQYQAGESQQVDPFWRNATVYFLLPDRFANGNPDNDLAYGREDDAAPLRGFMGGDLRGVIEKLEAGYFNDLGVDAIWMSPVHEQIQGATDEGTGRTYAYHGYWPRDWTAVDRNFGTEAELAELIGKARSRGIRVLLDVVINHTGPVTGQDLLAPQSWVRPDPVCDWSGFAGTVSCTLVDNLPDIRTESEEPVELPPQLLEKWQREGRLEQELAELDAFFARTGYPRAPKYYLVKWVTDWVREYGVDGFRVDTTKHVEPEVWAVLEKEASRALAEWRAENPREKLDDRDFFMVGEVYGFGANDFGVTRGRNYDFGDRQVDFYNYGFDSLINFDFSQRADDGWESLFSTYSENLHGGPLDGLGVLNYLSSHDDMNSFDRERQRTREAATKLMLAPGAAQIYYGDELARPLHAPDANGDAQLRSAMNWEDLEKPATQELLAHWQKLGQFRQAHLSVGAGEHRKLADRPYTFARTLPGEAPVVVALGLEPGARQVAVGGIFADGTAVRDFYSGQQLTVKDGAVTVDGEFDMVLLGPVDRG